MPRAVELPNEEETLMTASMTNSVVTIAVLVRSFDDLLGGGSVLWFL